MVIWVIDGMMGSIKVHGMGQSVNDCVSCRDFYHWANSEFINVWRAPICGTVDMFTEAPFHHEDRAHNYV